MITNLKGLLEAAKNGKYAVGAFNVYNYETIKAVIEAVKETRRPAIIAFGEKYLENMALKEVVNLVRTMSIGLDSDIAIHLDHTKNVDVIKKAIDAGFTSVMFDGSALSFEENMAQTKEVVDYAHKFNVSVEAELGCIQLGDHSNEDEGNEIYTDPLQARTFVLETGVDCLAVSIGTVHGMYKGVPKISVERLKEINQAIQIPFVLHGGSGTPLSTIQACIQEGITKINVNTEVSMTVVAEFSKMIAKNPQAHFSNLSTKATEVAKQTVIKYMDMFSPIQ
ncbi:MAG: class II fructose-bisphosphate aldolase [Candidatus Izemoplasmatales bacterium]|nr:class II fructose-bisphosphate aldolase [bacterium]MDZ4196500.1 class II fructose-bisphosphate aldolase [Candidatus Izemoplasmatales bacterium]